MGVESAFLSRRQLLASEIVVSPLKTAPAAVRVCVLFPNSYHTGMSSLAVHSLYGLLNSLEGFSCERAFLPDAVKIDNLLRSRQLLRSLDTDTVLGDFDLLAVTTSFELDWLHLPLCLDMGGIPPRRRDRDERHPFLLGGGPCFTANPAPVLDLFDAVYIGEVEQGLSHLKQLAQQPRTQWAEYLCDCPGFLVPGLSTKPVRRVFAHDLDEFITASVIVTPNTEFESSYLIEMSRGCGQGCSFCLAGQIYRPVRNRRVEALMEPIARGLAHTNRVGLVGASVSDYPWLGELCRALQDMEPLPQVSVSSMRADGRNAALFELLAAGGQRTVTLAPETGTEQLRQAVCKRLSDDALFEVIAQAVQAGLSAVKLYFLVGLPGETEHDRAEIATLVQRLSGEFPSCSWTVSLNPFVPKAHTPLQATEVPGYSTMRRHLAQVGAALRRLPKVQVRAGSARWATVQTAISRGDSRLGEALIAASLVQADFSRLRRVFADAGSDLTHVGRPLIAEAGGFPWDIVQAAYTPRVGGDG